jgi:hypothetical protein
VRIRTWHGAVLQIAKIKGGKKTGWSISISSSFGLRNPWDAYFFRRRKFDSHALLSETEKNPTKVIMDHNGGMTPLVDRESLDTRLASHERALAALNAEQAQLMKQLETLKAERQVLQAVARKVATSRRLSDGTQQE